MSKTIFPWVKPLGLSSSDFSQKPQGENHLVWGLKNRVINEQEYVAWASDFYKIPAIKPEFFSMAVDFSLIEKYANAFEWTSHCYPIYQWEDTLFVACLEPPKNGINLKTCFVIAPFTPLESAWQKKQNLHVSMPQSTEALPSIPVPAPVAEEAKPQPPISTADVDGLDFGNLTQEMGIEAQEVLHEDKPSEPQESESAEALDFSDMEGATAPTPEEKPEQAPAHEITHTSIDGEGFNGLTSATQTMHANADQVVAQNTQTQGMPFDNLSIGDISLEGEATRVESPQHEETKLDSSAPPIPSIPPIPEIPVESKSNNDALPVLDDLVAQKTDNPQQAPGIEDPKLTTEEESLQDHAAFQDDYTPVPVLTKAQQEAQAKRKTEAQQKAQAPLFPDTGENTITDHDQPIHTPLENQITDADLQRSDELETSDSMKLVVAHLFGHLKRDYKKLMWIELGDKGHYFPKYVLGDWKIITLAWKMHINISNPNMFRVAYKSGLPFHGKVRSNPYNEKYCEWWTRGKEPDMVTIYPVMIDEKMIGFITCFDKNTEFDEVGSLKKIENLVAICRKAFGKFSSSKAA